MTKTILAATILALSAAALPAFAAEEYQAGPARPITSNLVTRDVGAAQTPVFDGAYTTATPREQLVSRNSASQSIESLNSAPAGTLLGFLPLVQPAG